ncbi:adhesion G protein-coupled receptor E1 isoform X2 [Bombina bombina]|uniref:adhesion G protein-coupled receptor E1 isoform X2 n=1 Tax=Bombina bombina TaxID=8345 RepID=UPI00235AB085|nr:adhesion G protein-coupled receptor E1 isoform X2 [Bombina bombina]
MRPSGWCLLSVVCLLHFCLFAAGVQLIPEKFRNRPQCLGNSSLCPSNAFCENSQWGDFCICNDGYYNYKDSHVVTYPGGSCLDADECLYQSTCPYPAICINTVGSFICECPREYTNSYRMHNSKNVTVCVDIDECAQSPPRCPDPATCVNTVGNFSCICPMGFQSSICASTAYTYPTTSPVIDECILAPPLCIPPAVCTNTAGNISCTCPRGYTKSFDGYLNQTTCTDIDECSSSPSPCIPPATCSNTVGSFFCNCSEGYTLSNSSGGSVNHTTCTDIDECFSSPSPCIPPATCSNTVGSFFCNCSEGYTLSNSSGGSMNHTTCTDINECFISPPPCIPPATCSNIAGSFFCYCPVGYTLSISSGGYMNQTTCTDIDECSLSPSPCIPPATCSNIEGSFICNCPEGYTMSISSAGSRNLTTCTDRCKLDSKENEELEKCRTQNLKNPFCLHLNSVLKLWNSSCQGNQTEFISLQNLTENVSNILRDSSSLSNISSSELRVVVNSLLNSVESSALTSFIQTPRDEKFKTAELEVQTKVSRNSCIPETNFMHLTVGNSTMNVSCLFLPNHTDGAIFISYTNLGSHFSTNNLQNQSNIGEFDAKVMNSHVVTGTITSQNKINMNPPVTFYLQHIQEPDPTLTPLCVFWDPDLRAWSLDGCEVGKTNVSHTLCTCSHLSSFAIILAHRPIKEDYGLILLSHIGLSISLVCLLLSILTFLLCRSIRSAHTSILTVLCGCLFLGQLLILVGLKQTSNKILCSVIAGSLHFLLLCAFCWMSLESILLFLTVRNLRAVNYMTSQRSHFPYVCMLGFGVPVIIVSISVGMRWKEYGTDEHCWLSLNAIWSFLGPVCVFISMNTILLILTFLLLRAKLASLNTNVSTLKDTRLLTFKAFAQLFILGSAWIFGFFQIGRASLIFSYLFTGLNSLQGAFIFLVHCLLNRQVREEYRRTFHRLHKHKVTSDGASSSTFPMTTKSSGVTETSKADIISSHPTEEKYSATVQWT